MIKSSNSNLGTAVQNSAMLQSYLERKKKLLNNEIKSGEVGEKIVTAPKSKIDVSNIDLSNIKPNTLGTGDTLTPEETQRMLNDPRDFNIVKSGIKTAGKGVMVGVANVIESTNAIGTKILGKDADAINAKNLLREGDTGDKALDVFRGVTNFGWRSFPAYQFAHQMLGINQTTKESWERLEELYKDNQDNEQLKRVYNELKNGTYKGSVEDLERELSEIQTTIANEFRNKYTEDERIRLQEQLEENKKQYGEGIANKVLEGTSVVGQMVPTVLAGLVNPTASVVTIGLNAGGGAYAQALSEGAQADEAYNYGVLSGVIEAIIEQFGGERINKALGLKTKSPTGGWINSIKNKYLRFAIGVGKDVLEEGIEEVVATILDPFLQRITYNENANYDNIWQEIGNAFVDSIIPTLLLGGFGTARRSLENITINSIEKINSSPNLTTKQKAIGKNQIEQINKETSKKITQIEKTMLDKEQIPQNNVQNISKMENTYQNQKTIEEDIKNNIDKTTLIAGKNSNTRQKRRQIVTEYLKNRYPNNEIEFAINYDTGDVRIGNIRNKQALEQYEKGTMEIRQKQVEEYNRKHPETTVEDELNLTYNELPDNKQTSDILEINDRIDELSQKLNQQGYDISIEHSKGSLDASYINVGTKQIRVANHYKSGVSGRGADIDINMSEYGSKNVLLKDIERQIKEIGSAEKTRYDVDINKNKEYTTRIIERKQDPRNYIYKKITDKDKARVSSDYMLNKDKYKDKNFVHFVDVSYGYIIKNGEIEVVSKFKGSQKFIRDVEEAWGNGFDKLSNGNIKVAKSIRSAKRRSNTSNDISRGQSKSRDGNREITRDGGQQRRIDSTETIKNNGNDLKNSEQQGSNFLPEERYDAMLELTPLEKLENYEEQQKEILKKIAKDLGISYSFLDANKGTTQREMFWFLKNNENLRKQFIQENGIVLEGKTGSEKYDLVEGNPKFEKFINKITDEYFKGNRPKLTDEEVMEIAQDFHGTTEDFSVGAYMTIDGQLLDFDDGGYRDDHRTLEVPTYTMVDFMNAGNIRMQPEGNGFEIIVEPTDAQYERLAEYIDDYLDGEVYVDISDEKGNSVAGENYVNGTSSAKILNDIKEYFRTGEYPKKSELDDFRYDLMPTMKDGFYSQLENTIINKMPRQASSKDVMNLILKNGVKQDEIAWTGIDDFLASKDTVTKEEVLEYIRANQIEIEEVIKDDRQRKNFAEREEKIRQERQEIEEEIGELLNYYLVTRNGSPISALYHHMVKTAWKDEGFTTLVDLGKFEKNGDKYMYENYEEGARSFTEKEMQKDMRRISKLYKKFEILNKELSEMEDEGWKLAGSDTKFQKYATDWQDEYDNYREILFTIPNIEEEKEFTSVHWKEKNVLAHTRLQDYEDDSGAKVLFIEEIQSDMHQEGRKYGYKAKYEDLDKKIDNLKDEALNYKDALAMEQKRRKKAISNYNVEIRYEAKEILSEHFIRYGEYEHELLVPLEKKTDTESHVAGRSEAVIIDTKYLSDEDIQTTRESMGLSQEELERLVFLHNTEIENLKEYRDVVLEIEEIEKNNKELQNLYEQIETLREEKRNNYKKIDSKFPFKKNWHEFVLRKIINEAVKNGYDKVAWTTGKQQNDRYNLAKYIEKIKYVQNKDKTYSIYATDKQDNTHNFKNQTESELENIVGKEITQKIISGEYDSKGESVLNILFEGQRTGEIKGVDLEIGGDGMKGFYDKIIPEYLNKYLKKWDSKVEEVIISDGLEEHKQQGFTITPKMIEAVNTVGQPLYEKTTEGQKANINRVRNAVMDILGLEETGNKKILDEMAIRVNFAINRNALDDKEIKRIVNDISKELVNITEPTVTEKRIKAILQGTKIYVPENVKKDIVEWNVFRKNLFGTLKLSNDEQNEPIDTFYQELNEMFGEVYFPSKISNETDQLKKIAQVGKSIRTKRISFEKYFKNEYGKEAWAEVLEDIENELKDIREELSYEINTKSDELKLTPELFTALGNVGIPIEMLEDDKNEWAKGIAKFFSDDYKYYEQNLKDIEKQNLETGTRTTNYILNKRRIDVILGRTPRNEKYSGGVSPRDIRESIEKSINKKIGVKGFRAKAYGVYKPNVDAIRVKDISNIETELHELGHRIDYKVLKNIITNESSGFRKELNSLSQRAFLNTYDTPEMKRLTKQIAKTKDTIKNLEKYIDARNMSKRANPNSKARLNARERLEKAKIDLPELEAELEKAIVSDTNVDNMREGWAEATKRFVVDNENFIKEYPEVAKYILNEMENNKALNKQLTDLITLAEKYINSTPEEQISALISIGEDTDKQEKRKFFDQYMYNMHDDLWDIKKWQKNISKSKGNKYYETRAEDNIYTLMRLNKANEDVIINSLKYGIISDNGNRVTKGITDIIEKITPGEYQNLRNFMIARRTLDYFAKGLASGVQVADTIALINHYSKDAKLVQMANDLTEMQNKTLEYLGKDFMDKADMKELRKWNRLYIPMKRVFDGKVNSSTGGKQLSKLTKERTGSQRDIIDPLESIIQNTSMLISKKRQNDWMKKVADQIKESGYAEIAEEIDPPQALKAEVSLELFKNALEEQGVDTDEIDLEVVARIFNPKLNDEATMTIGFMDNGKLRALQFKDKNVYKVVTEGGGNVVSDVLALADKVTGLLRLGATQANLEFAIPNVISDTMGAWIYSESGFVPGVDSIKGVIDYMMANYDWANDMVKNTEYGKNNKYMYDLYMQSGATMSTRVASYRPEVQDYLKEIFGKNASKVYSENKKTAEKAVKDIWEAIKKAPHSVQDLLTAIPELSEQGTRFANFKKDYNYFKKKGYNHKNALIQSAINTRDITTDFNRMGNYFRVYNRLKAFSSARAQSIYRFAEGMAKQPKKLLPKIGAMVAISIAILKASIDADREEYEEIADQTKKDNFLITLPNGEFLKIKKPQGTVRSIINFFEMLYGVGAGSIPEEEYDQAWNNWIRDTVEENSGIELDLREGRDIFQIVQGAFLPTALEPIIENAQNVDFYYGNPIIPYGKENLRPSEQYDENTSQTAIIIGDIFNISPAKLENLITGWFAGVGQQALDISDKVLGELSKDIPEQPAKEKSEQFVLKRFFANPYRNSDSVSEVYDNMAKLEELKEYGEATESDIEKLDNLEKATKTMSDLNKKIKTTRNSLTLNAEEKKNKIKELQELRTDTARYYLGKELINTQNEEQIKLYEFYPPSESYNYQPNKLTKVTITLTEEEKKKYAEICKKEYEDAMAKIEKKASYKNASEEEKIKQRDSELTKARNIAKEEVLKEAYKRNKGAK